MLKKLFLSISRFEWVKIIIGIAFIIQVLLSLKLWYSVERLYPITPMFGIQSFWTNKLMQMILLWVLLISALGLIFIRNMKVSTMIFLVVLSLFFIQDVSRIQAWSYQYFMMVFVLAIFAFFKNTKNTLVALQLVLIFTYFWSGIQKFNIYFAEMVYPWLLEAHPVLSALEEYSTLAYVIAVFETLLGN